MCGTECKAECAKNTLLYTLSTPRNGCEGRRGGNGSRTESRTRPRQRDVDKAAAVWTSTGPGHTRHRRRHLRRRGFCAFASTSGRKNGGNRCGMGPKRPPGRGEVRGAEAHRGRLCGAMRPAPRRPARPNPFTPPKYTRNAPNVHAKTRPSRQNFLSTTTERSGFRRNFGENACYLPSQTTVVGRVNDSPCAATAGA